jgi:hypothetical protein
MLSVDPDPLFVDEGIMRRSSLRRFVEEIIKNSNTMKNQEMKDAGHEAAKKKNILKHRSMITAAAFSMMVLMTACSASSGTTSSPKQIAAQEKFQSALVAAQLECEKKVEAARAEAESESKR